MSKQNNDNTSNKVPSAQIIKIHDPIHPTGEQVQTLTVGQAQKRIRDQEGELDVSNDDFMCCDGIFCCDDNCCDGRTVCGSIGQMCTCVICCPPWTIFALASHMLCYWPCCCWCGIFNKRGDNCCVCDALTPYLCIIRFCCSCCIPRNRIKELDKHIDKKIN